MNRTLARILLGLPGLFIFTTGLVFLTNPEAAGDKLLLAADGSEGLSNLRGMAGAPILAVGVSQILAAITGKLEYARPTAIFLLTLIAARVGSYLIDGPTDAIGLFIAVPSVAFGLMAVGHVLLDRSERERATVEGVPSRAS